MICLVGILFVILLETVIFKQYEEKLISDIQLTITDELSAKTVALNATLNRRLAILHGIIAFSESIKDQNEIARYFDDFAAGLIKNTSGIRALILAPNGTQTFVHPLQGNEKIVGRNIFANVRPEQLEALQRTVESPHMVLNGPYQLLQGGLGLVARQSIYRDNEFWGLATIIIDMPAVLTEAGLEVQGESTKFALRKSTGDVFYGAQELFQAEPVVLPVILPDGQWQLAAGPQHSWQESVKPQMKVVRSLGYFILVLLLGLVYSMFIWQEQLKHIVLVRTAELKEKSVELKQVVARLQDSNLELEQFAYVASHDLKAPLRAVANLSQWVEDDLTDKNISEETKENLALMRSRTRRMENLINGILQYSKIGRGNIEVVAVDVDEVIKEIIEDLALPKDMAIIVGAGMPIVHTNPTMLRQVFANLIENAIKYRDKNKKAHISITVVELDPFYEFTVKDNGIGIAPQFHEKVFGMFQILESRDKNESTGMGLTIVKKIIKYQGGSIHLDSQEGEGASFTFTWPKIG